MSLTDKPMKPNTKHNLIQRKLFVGIVYPLLLVAAICTMVPLLWLISSSFKTADEIFAVPIRWLPKLPPRVTFSPYIVNDTYPKIKKPAAVNPKTWKTLKPELEKIIWEKVQYNKVATRIPSSVLPDDFQTEITKGIWHQHVATLPTEVWNGPANSIIKEVKHSVTSEKIYAFLLSATRQVILGKIEIEDVEFNRFEVDSAKWNADSEIIAQLLESSIARLSYNFESENNVHMTTTISSPVPIDRIRRIILPVQGDASYHHLSLTVSVNGTTYQPKRPFVLDTALQEDTVWRLHGIPGELESSHIPMRRIEANDETPKPEGALEKNAENNLFLQLTIHRPAYLSIVWNKLTTNYRNLWEAVPYNRYFINSVFIATASTLLALFFCSLGGFAFAKYQFRGKTILFGIVLASMMVPFQVLLVPLFGLMSDIGWLNSYNAIIFPFSVGAFGVFLMRQFIVTIPSELLDAARIDGCSEFGIYYRIVLPIIKPALGALTIYTFLSSWNGYLWPLIVLRDETKYTLPIGLANLIGIYRQDYGMLMAGTLLSILPIVILFLAMQREFVQGITLGSVKE